MNGTFLGWLFRAPAEPRRSAQVIWWWEVRRIPYNVIVGVVGLASVVLFYLISGQLLKPGEDAVEPIALVLGMVVGPVAINIAYTMGWLAELIVRDVWRVRSTRFAPKLLKLGIAFSLSLELFPSATVFVVWIARMI